jgi:hypothetical protein
MTPAAPRLLPAIDRFKAAVKHWNELPGEIWDIKVQIDEPALTQCLQVADSVFGDGRFPEKPGPFKLLASYALAVQYLSPYNWKAGPRASFDTGARYWDPRLVIWTLPYVSELLTLGAEKKPLPVPITFPTPHLQLEAINYLRIVHQSKQGASVVDPDHLIEQVLLFGLCIEGSAYASYPDTSRLAPIMKHAEKCIYNNDDPRWPDQHFMDKDFFEDYFQADEISVD